MNILNWNNEIVGNLELRPDTFNVEVRNEILHEVVVWQLAKRRAGNHQVKTRSFVSGGGKKPFKQKGTGGARQGTSRSPLMPGGGKLFGPERRIYEYSLPKKIRQLGIKMALSNKNFENKIFIISEIESNGKTKELFARMGAFQCKSIMFIDSMHNENFSRACSNLKGIFYGQISSLNVYDILSHEALFLTPESLVQLYARLSSE